MDKSGMPLDHKQLKVLHLKRSKKNAWTIFWEHLEASLFCVTVASRVITGVVARVLLSNNMV